MRMTKALLEYNLEVKRIRDRNRRFAKMSAARKRVTIAQDVLDWLMNKRIVATSGTYVAENLLINGDKLRPSVQCNVCALGAMFCTLTARVKDLSIKLHASSSPASTLFKYFSPTQVDLIESAFEGWGDYDHSFSSYNEVNSNDRLAMIMQNIVDNKGTFIP
jgi:hypothetical protein